MLKKYDADKSGNLDANELIELLAHHDHGIRSDWNEYHTELVMQNIGKVAPTSEEISWLLKASKNNAQSTVGASDIGFILDLWHSYVMNREMLEKAFEKFDLDCNHQLEFDQLKNYLTELNQGQVPKVTLHQTHSSDKALISITSSPLTTKSQ
jgi:Ca2+-binding EF-hand superfamily protein